MDIKSLKKKPVDYRNANIPTGESQLTLLSNSLQLSTASA
jgi:hypothetical protein